MQPGESLTSLICRQSRACFMTPRQLFTAMNLRLYGPLGDLDVASDGNLLLEFSQRLGIPVENLQKGLLDGYQAGFLSPALREVQKGQGRLPRHRQWVLANGWQNNPWPSEPRPGGIPFCPLCFQENRDPWFPLIHRFCTTISCERHRVLLVDACPRCGYPVSPFTLRDSGDWSLRTDGPLCTQCLDADGRLRRTDASALRIEPATFEIVRIQGQFLAALTGKRVNVPQVGEMSAKRFLAGVRHGLAAANFLLGLGLEAGEGVEARFGSAQPPLFREKHQPSLEFQPLAERRRWLLWIDWMMHAPLDRWHLILGMPGAPTVMEKRSRHPWEHIGEEGEPLERSSPLSRSYHKHLANPVGQVNKFFMVVETLGLTHDVARSILGGISERMYQNWRRLPSLRIPAACHHRMEHFLRIWDGVLDLNASVDAARRWMLRKNRHPGMLGLPPVYFLARDMDGSRFEAVSQLLGRTAFTP